MPEDPWRVAALVCAVMTFFALIAHAYFDWCADRSADRARDAAVREADAKARRDVLATLQPVAAALDAGDQAVAARAFHQALKEIGQADGQFPG